MDGYGENFFRHIGVYGICLADNCILVIQKILGPYTGKYDLPGGRLEKMESLEQGVTREFLEETGYTIRQLKSIGICDFSVLWTLQDDTVEHLHHIAMLYEVQVNPEEKMSIIKSFEGQDSNGAIWLNIDHVNINNASPLLLSAMEWMRAGAVPVVNSSYDYRI